MGEWSSKAVRTPEPQSDHRPNAQAFVDVLGTEPVEKVVGKQSRRNASRHGDPARDPRARPAGARGFYGFENEKTRKASPRKAGPDFVERARHRNALLGGELRRVFGREEKEPVDPREQVRKRRRIDEHVHPRGCDPGRARRRTSAFARSTARRSGSLSEEYALFAPSIANSKIVLRLRKT